MLYSILIYAPEDLVEAMSKEEEESHISRHLKVHEKLSAAGRLGPCVRLMPTTTAVQFRTSTTAHIVDGPFAETKEQLLGFYVVDCGSLEEAIEAAKGMVDEIGAMEIRPLRLFRPGATVKPMEDAKVPA